MQTHWQATGARKHPLDLLWSFEARLAPLRAIAWEVLNRAGTENDEGFPLHFERALIELGDDFDQLKGAVGVWLAERGEERATDPNRAPR